VVLIHQIRVRFPVALPMKNLLTTFMNLEKFKSYYADIKEKVHLKKKEQPSIPLPALVRHFLSGYISETELLSNIDVKEIGSFVKLVSKHVQDLKASRITERGQIFKVNQLQRLAEVADLETKVRKAKGENVVQSLN
jgi:hypothetical protein